MKRFTFNGSHAAGARKFVVPKGQKGERYYGIGIAGAPPEPVAGVGTYTGKGAHGIVLAFGGVPIGPGAPLLLEGIEQSIPIELSSYLTGPVHIQVATCLAELELLRAPRGPYVSKQEIAVSGLPATHELIVPFHGRAKFSGMVYLAVGGVATGLTVITKARWYTSTGAVRSSVLNTYTAAADIPAAGTAKAYHETERCDEIALHVEHSSGSENFEFEANAFDEGT